MHLSTNVPVRLTAMLLALAVVAAACGSSNDSEEPIPASTSTPPADGTEPDADPAAAESIDWEPCGALECGTVEVPVDYDDPSAGTLEIAVNVHRATGERVGYLVVNPGGPGESGLELAVSAAEGGFGAELVEAFDIVGFDPRGVGASAPAFGCGAPGEYMALLGAIDGPVDTDAEIAAGEAAVDLCVETMGPSATQLHTPNVARDIDQIRQALGADDISYLGFSYGSVIGVWYATLFPGNVRSMVVDGAPNPAGQASVEIRIANSVGQAAEFSELLAQALAACDDPSCPIYNDGDPTAAFTAAAAKSHLISVEFGGLPIAGALGILTPLYSETDWPRLWQGLADLAERDDPSILVEFAAMQFDPNVGVSFTEHVNCLDSWIINPDSDRTDRLAENALIDETVSADFPLLSQVNLEDVSVCPFFDEIAPDSFAAALDGGGVNILVVGNRSDPATPFLESEQLATTALSNGFLVETDHFKHVVYPENTCVVDLVHDALINGAYPANQRTVCEREDAEPIDEDDPFFTLVVECLAAAEEALPDVDEDERIAGCEFFADTALNELGPETAIAGLTGDDPAATETLRALLGELFAQAG